MLAVSSPSAGRPDVGYSPWTLSSTPLCRTLPLLNWLSGLLGTSCAHCWGAHPVSVVGGHSSQCRPPTTPVSSDYQCHSNPSPAVTHHQSSTPPTERFLGRRHGLSRLFPLPSPATRLACCRSAISHLFLPATSPPQCNSNLLVFLPSLQLHARAINCVD